jgi:hypothetical protein
MNIKKSKHFKNLDDLVKSYYNQFEQIVKRNLFETLDKHYNHSLNQYYQETNTFIGKKYIDKSAFDYVKRFNTYFGIHNQILRKLFGRVKFDGKYYQVADLLNKYILENDKTESVHLRLLHGFSKPLKTINSETGKHDTFSVANRYVFKPEYKNTLDKEYSNKTYIKDFLNLESSYWSESRTLAYNFLKFRKAFNPKTKVFETINTNNDIIDDENIVVNTTNTITEEKPIETKPIEKTIEQPILKENNMKTNNNELSPKQKLCLEIKTANKEQLIGYKYCDIMLKALGSKQLFENTGFNEPNILTTEQFEKRKQIFNIFFKHNFDKYVPNKDISGLKNARDKGLNFEGKLVDKSELVICNTMPSDEELDDLISNI